MEFICFCSMMLYFCYIMGDMACDREKLKFKRLLCNESFRAYWYPFLGNFWVALRKQVQIAVYESCNMDEQVFL